MKTKAFCFRKALFYVFCSVLIRISDVLHVASLFKELYVR